MSGVCLDCEHWDQAGFDLPSLGRCTKTLTVSEIRQDLDSLAWADSDSVGESVLITTYQFGCNQFQDKSEG